MQKLLGISVVLILASTAWADIINDDFESYADNTQLGAVWPIGVGTTADTYLDLTDNGPTWPGDRCVYDTTVASRRDQSFAPTEVTGSDYLVWAYDYYDTVGNTGDPRQYGQLLSQASGGGLNELLAMGQYNTVTMPGEVFNANKYQARVAFAAGQGWFNLNTNRAVGWHRFEARVYADHVDFYVDGAFDRGPFPHAGVEWYQARIGSGLSSAEGDAKYDNYLLTLVPEPAALTLLALGGLVLVRRR